MPRVPFTSGDRPNCPNCGNTMSRALDGSGRWTCLPCGKRWEHDELLNAVQAANPLFAGIDGEIAKLRDILTGHGR